MGLTKIKLVGFKSFADEETILFENGVTGIVGPNGCGKSNVADAIRWVIGETSPKQMRGSTMQDVIFNGTETRKLLSVCEVSLYFDNRKGEFPHLDYEEVIFTRKLYRDGESCYYINHQPARLKDIISNLHDVGISKDGYSIIGQGKVADIMSSKPEDRRAVFEEATDIAKAKKKRAEAMKNLEKSKIDLREHASRIKFLGDRLGPKAAAAEKTNEFNKLSAELKTHEVNTYIANYESANGKRLEIDEKIALINDEISAHTVKLNEAQFNYNKYSAEVNEVDAHMADLNSKILEATVKAGEVSGDIKAYNERINFLKAEIDRLVKENTKSRLAIEDLTNQSKQNNSEKEKIAVEVRELSERISQLNVEIDALNLKIGETEQEQQSVHDKAMQSAESFAKIMQNIGSLEAEKSVLVERNREVQAKVYELKERYKAQSAKKAKLESEVSEKENALSVYAKKCEEKELQISEIDEKIESITDKLYTLNSEYSAMQSKYNLYSNVKDNYEGYNPVVQRLMKDAKYDNALKSRIKNLVASVISTDKQYEIAIETALGASAQNVITETPDDAKYILEYLKRERAGRLTCLPITSVKPRADMPDTERATRERGALGLATELVKYDDEYENVIRFLLGNTLICKDTDCALDIAKKYRFNFKIVTLDGQIYSANGSMTGGSVKQNNSSLLSVENQVSQMEKTLSEKSKEMMELKRRKDELADKSDSLVAELDSLSEKTSSIRQELAPLKEQLAVATSTCEAIKVDLDGYNEALRLLSEKISGLSSKVSDVEEGNKKLQQERQALDSDTKKQKDIFEAQKAKREKLIAERSELQSELTQKTELLVNAENEEKRLTLAIASNKEQIQKNNDNIAADNDIIAEIKKSIEAKALPDEENEQLEEFRHELEVAKERKVELAMLVKEEEDLRQEFNQKLSDSVEKKHKEEEKRIKIDSDLEYLQERVFTQYEMDYEACKPFKIENYNVEEGAQEIKRLRTRINFLGPVNPNAPEEYEAENNEYLTLCSEQEDMEKSIADIENVIGEVTEEMTKKFNDGFAKIREYFKTIFKVMFGGGDADLSIEEVPEGEDPLNAGIDIKAQPPGKSLRSISLLSGGEQALTAIAILFAILKLRPLPFCVLDEIEAPLDDTNVVRFANYLKKFAEDTQFIVITHKKPTMERADALYGVTMPEKGVSKTVSVKLTEAARYEVG